MSLLFVAIGCGCGGVARHLLNQWISAWFGAHFPWGTLVVNLLGSLLLGLFFALVTASGPEQARWHEIVATGFCGGLTTFSTFSLQTVTLVGEQRLKTAIVNVLLSLGACLSAAAGGFALGGVLWR